MYRSVALILVLCSGCGTARDLLLGAPDWSDQPAELTNADILGVGAVDLSVALQGVPVDGVEAVRVDLNATGEIDIDVLLASDTVREIQRSTSAASELAQLRRVYSEALFAYAGRDWFGDDRPSAAAGWLDERRASDVRMVAGLRHEGRVHRLATIDDRGVVLDPSAPMLGKSRVARNTAAPAPQPPPTKSDNAQAQKMIGRLFDKALDQVDLAHDLIRDGNKK